jgi:hypothetical protein
MLRALFLILPKPLLLTSTHVILSTQTTLVNSHPVKRTYLSGLECCRAENRKASSLLK